MDIRTYVLRMKTTAQVQYRSCVQFDTELRSTVPVPYGMKKYYNVLKVGKEMNY